MRYVIRRAERLDRQPENVRRAPWGLYVEHPGKLLMDRIGLYKSKGAAITTARLLAGRTHEVVVEV
jgi:hypothetical protein